MRVRHIILSACGLFFLLCFSIASAQGPGKAAFMEAENLWKQKRAPEAFAKYDEALKLEPQNYKYLFTRGKRYFSQNKVELALPDLEQAIGIKNDYTPAISLLAKAYEKKGDLENAVFYYDEAFKYEQDNSRKVVYKMNAVGILLKAGKKDEALDHIRDAKAVDPENLNLLYYEAKFANEAGDHNTAKTNMLTATSKLTGQPEAQIAKYYYELGVAYNGLGDYTSANKAWEKAYIGPYKSAIDRERSKNSPAFYYRVAVSYYMTGQYDEAETHLNKALELQNNFAPAHQLKGKIAKKQGNYTKAIDHFNDAAGMEQDPKKKAGILMQMVNLQSDAGDYSGALSTANELLATQPNNYNLIYTKALCYYNKGQYDSAISTLESGMASTIDANNKAKFNFLIGMSAKHTDPEKAKEAFRAASFGAYKGAAKVELEGMASGKSR